MRENIGLYHGKRKDNGEWIYWNIYGELCRLSGKRACLSIPNKSGESCYYYVHQIKQLIDPETIGEYTGLTDKNGKRIFEGDILLYCGVQNVVVSFENGQFVINHYAINLLKARNAESEVIGNIHDNPELLEVEE